MVTAWSPRLLAMRSRAAVSCARRSSWSTRFGTAPSCPTPSFYDTTVSLHGRGRSVMVVLIARHGDLEIAYERLGDPSGEPLLLVMGVGAQMVGWPDGFCALLGKRGFDVVRFDNRDAGLSTHLDDAPPVRRLRPRPVYSLSDMAGDAVAVADAVGWSAAHVVGASMGGMIAQTVAIE